MTRTERVARALSPLVNEDMDEVMREAWLTDLATAALTAIDEERDALREAAAWRTDKLPFEDQPIYQFVLLEGYQEHSGQTWHRRFAGTACIAKHNERFGYRASDIDRIQTDGDMIVVERVVGWMPATYPKWDFDQARSLSSVSGEEI